MKKIRIAGAISLYFSCFGSFCKSPFKNIINWNVITLFWNWCPIHDVSRVGFAVGFCNANRRQEVDL